MAMCHPLAAQDIYRVSRCRRSTRSCTSSCRMGTLPMRWLASQQRPLGRAAWSWGQQSMGLQPLEGLGDQSRSRSSIVLRRRSPTPSFTTSSIRTTLKKVAISNRSWRSWRVEELRERASPALTRIAWMGKSSWSHQMRRKPWRLSWVSRGTTLDSTLNQTPERGRKLETNRGTCLTVYTRGRGALCLLASVVPIKGPCPWMPSPWVGTEQLEEDWLEGEMSPVPHWSNRRTWTLQSEELLPMAFREAWVCVYHGAIQQEGWAEEWGCIRARPCRGQETGGCRGRAAALWLDQDTPAWVVLVQWEDP